MYGTVARLKLKPGQEEALKEVMREWDDDRKPNVEGAIGSYVYQLDKDPGQWIMAVQFKDRETYVKNADDPKTDAWYRRVRELLEEDPIWEDGEIIFPSAKKVD